MFVPSTNSVLLYIAHITYTATFEQWYVYVMSHWWQTARCSSFNSVQNHTQTLGNQNMCADECFNRITLWIRLCFQHYNETSTYNILATSLLFYQRNLFSSQIELLLMPWVTTGYQDNLNVWQRVTTVQPGSYLCTKYRNWLFKLGTCMPYQQNRVKNTPTPQMVLLPCLKAPLPMHIPRHNVGKTYYSISYLQLIQMYRCGLERFQ